MSYSSQKGLTWLNVFFFLVLAIVLVGLAIPLILRKSPGGARTEAINNAKAIAGGLVAFKTDKGAYPCAFTREALEKDGFNNLPKGTDANAYLAQLIVTDIIDDEGVFHASGVRVRVLPQKGDSIKGTPEPLFAPGENGFAYIMAANEEPLTDVTSNTPLVLSPLLEAGKKPTFDSEPYKGEGVYGAVDGSGKFFSIDENGHASTKDHEELFATGPGSLFGADIPIIKPPGGLKRPRPKKQNWWPALLLLPFIGGLWWLASRSKKTPEKVPEY